MRFHRLLPSLLLTAQCFSPIGAYMQQRPVENAPGPEDTTSRSGAKSSCEDNAPIPALESEPQKQAVKDREMKAENASQNEGECATDGVVGEDDIAIDDISDTYFGVAQDISGETSSEVAALLAQSKVYMSKVVNVDPQYSAVRADCRNHEALCTFWATIGECDGNPAYMKLHCAPACQSCEQLDINVRCPLDPNVEDWLGPGDLDALFERMVADPYYNRQYQLTVISRPSHPPDSTEAERMDANYTIGPWMVTFDNFLSPEEADTIIELGAQEGYVRSTDVGKRNFDGTYGDHRSSQRTSENSWCQNECYDNPITQTVLSRIENLTGIPDENSEYLQLLKYEEGQFYGVHNDFIEYQVDRPVGSRILTFYMYLNDVEEGGGTRFPQVGGTGGTTVIPKRGRAVLWPSVLNENPNRKDHRTEHEAMPVIRGVKYGANAWIHNRNFKGPNENGCS